MSSLWFLSGLVLLAALWQLLKRKKSNLPSYLRGPRPKSWLFGNQVEVFLSQAGEANRRWKSAYGLVYKYKGCFGDEYLVLNDANAFQHVVKGQTTKYVLDNALREFLRLVTGEGLIWADGTAHARQRRLLSPAFTPVFIKSLAPTFSSCVSRLVSQWSKRIDAEAGPDGYWKVDAYNWLELLTMEAIGSTAFGVHFGALEGQEHPLRTAYTKLISNNYSRPTKLSIALGAAALHIPASLVHHVQMLPLPGLHQLSEAKRVSRKWAHDLMVQKRIELAADSQVTDRDFLTVLVRAGEKNEKDKVDKMSDEEIYNNLTTFFIAGYDTATNTTSFALIEVARHKECQEKLYRELVDVLGSPADRDLADGFSADLLDRMPYLQAVMKETLRYHAAIHSGLFKAAQDDFIPLSQPIETPDGRVKTIPVKAGQRIICAADGLNRSEEVWGPLAGTFQPERWLRSDPVTIPLDKQCGGVYANLGTFGGGPKVCIGWRFAILEISIFVAAIVREFELDLVHPDWDLWRDGSFIGTIPMENGHVELGPQCPLRIRRRQTPVQRTASPA